MYPNVVHRNPKAADKSWNINQSQYPYIWQCQNLTDLSDKTWRNHQVVSKDVQNSVFLIIS